MKDLFAYEVDPQNNPIVYNRSDAGLELWLMFCIMVAGKSAKTTVATLQRFISEAFDDNDPYYLVRRGGLRAALERARTGQYGRLEKAFSYLAEHFTADKLRIATVEELELVPGIGPKTARFFLLSTRQGVRYAALDTHLLKWLRTEEARPYLDAENLGALHVPKSTPTSKAKYAALERCVLRAAEDKGMTPAAFDYGKKKNQNKLKKPQKHDRT
jgi:thermostable 8-oxoguanine DNA glycosylase